MKLTLRIAALTVVLAGAAAATVSSSTLHSTVSHQAISAALPAPICTPGMPTCQMPKLAGKQVQ
jgi:uncharacterized membrane protein